MEILNATLDDIDVIFKLYRMASDYQREKKHVVVWPDFKRELVETELKEQRQYKLIIDDQIACIWAITFSDAQIWEARNKDSAVYIHRIATNPDFRGHNFVGHIVAWAKKFAKAHHLDYIRLDTLGDNKRLINHYTKAGFKFLGMFDLKNTDQLPAHYQSAPACLFEIQL